MRRFLLGLFLGGALGLAGAVTTGNTAISRPDPVRRPAPPAPPAGPEAVIRNGVLHGWIVVRDDERLLCADPVVFVRARQIECE